MQSQSAPVATVSASPTLTVVPDKPEPSLSWCLVTPEMAGTWLAKNQDNRSFRKTTARLYAHQMEAGLWRADNPDPIIFDINGRLLNGQHRLSAVVDSQCEIRFLVGRNFPLDLRDVLDTGKSRNAPDLLSIKYPETSTQSAVYTAALRSLRYWEKNPTLGPSETGTANMPLSNQEVVDLWETYGAGLQSVISMATAIQTHRIRGGRGTWMALLYRFSQLDAEATRVFAEKMATGAGLVKGDPLLVLYNRLLNAEPSGVRSRREVVARLIVNAWNAWVRGEKRARLLTPSHREGKPLDFPVPLAPK